MRKNLFSNFRLAYQNPAEEFEYCQFRTPFIKELCVWLFVFIALLLVPLTCRYILKNLYPQVYFGISFLGLAVIIFLARSKLKKYLEFISIIYLSLILVLYIVNMRLILDHQKPYEAFYMGYGFALIQRMLDYRIGKFPLFIAFNVLFTILKFTLVTIPDGALGALVVCLEVFPMIISFKVERAERFLFDSLHKSKCQFLKFKTCLTEYFPSRLAVLVENSPNSFYVNNSFKKSFECGDITQLKASLQKINIDGESVDKNKEIFSFLGHDEAVNESKPLTLSSLLDIVSNKIREIQVSTAIVLQGNQDENILDQKIVLGPNRLPQTISQEEDHSLLPNNQASRIFNRENTYQAQETLKLGADINRLSPTGSRNRVSSNERLAINSGELAEHYNRNSDTEKPLSRRIWKATIFSLIWDNNDAVAVLLDDITYERTILELEIADKNKDMVMAMVSHELRTPLNGMLGMLNIMEKKLSKLEITGQSDLSYYLGAFRTNSQLLLNLVNSILDFSQFNNNKLTLDYTQVNVQDLLESIRPLFDHFCKAKNLQLNFEIARSVPQKIVTDKGRLTQILINLLGNAFKFTFKGGVTVKVTLEQINPHRIRFSVEDTGIGIKKEDIDKLFKLFGKLKQNNKINRQGVGLGLTLSNTLAKLLDPIDPRGIEVTSEFGEGTVFTFTVESKSVKVRSEEAESISEQQGNVSIQDKMNTYFHEVKDKKYAEASSLLKMRASDKNGSKTSRENTVKPLCLLVDDNPFNLMVAQHAMEDRGYQIMTALNGREAIERVQQQQQQQQHKKEDCSLKLILMDCEMPVMNGYEASKVLRKMMRDGEISDCPIIAVTANLNDVSHKKLFEEAGISGYIGKPLQMDKLEEILKDFKVEQG